MSTPSIHAYFVTLFVILQSLTAQTSLINVRYAIRTIGLSAITRTGKRTCYIRPYAPRTTLYETMQRQREQYARSAMDEPKKYIKFFCGQEPYSSPEYSNSYEVWYRKRLTK